MRVTKCLYCGSEELVSVARRSDGIGILECADCRMMMVDKVIDSKELYGASYFEKDQKTEIGYTNYLSSPAATLTGKYAFARLFASAVGKHLDLGCADGSLIEIFEENGFSSSGFEVSEAAVDAARVKGLDVELSDFHDFSEWTTGYDVITMFDVLEHTDNPRVVLREIHKRLKENGYFVFSTVSVKAKDNTDHWFNNSLEHYVYFDRQSMEFILKDVFGEGNFWFMEMGPYELWGIGKKGSIQGEKKTIKCLESLSYDAKDAQEAYLLSLFYDQISEFEKSREIIELFAKDWSSNQLVLAKFFNNYYSGRVELAVSESRENGYLLPGRSTYWQALSDAKTTLFEIKKADMLRESTDQILGLQEQIFSINNELGALRNSRVVGRIIKARDFIVPKVRGAKHIPMRISRALFSKIIRPVLVRVVPKAIRKPVMKMVRKKNVRQPEIIYVENQKISEKSPLVSVIVPYYNRADVIDFTIDSLSKQTFKDFEVILVDDGSSDSDSKEKLNKLKRHGLKLQIIHQDNQGVSRARNNGIEASRGKYVLCLDSDDTIEPTYIEKQVIILESKPDIGLVTTYMKMFGAKNESHHHNYYNATHLIEDNTVITAAMFRKEAWEATGGYKSGIGYEDWEYWISLAELGFFGQLIPEELFNYRVAVQSRYVEDKNVHWANIKHIKSLHQGYKTKIKKHLLVERQTICNPDTVFLNLDDAKSYNVLPNKRNILIVIPWMTIGGAETLIYNFCKEIKDKYNIFFITCLKSENEWEWKFRQISSNIYHLPNLFDDQDLMDRFIKNFIKTRSIDVVHIIHNNRIFHLVEELKERFSKLKIIITMFNDRVPEYFQPSVDLAKFVDVYTTDNNSTGEHYKKALPKASMVKIIPNGIDSNNVYAPSMFNRAETREKLGLSNKDLAVFFVGRLSEEKKPDVFVKAAKSVLSDKQIKNMKFFIIGDGHMRKTIENAMQDIPSDAIEYLGYQDNVAEYLSAGDIFVLPSSIEGFPLSILEAMAMNLVVIASNVGAVSDIVENGKDGFVVTPCSAEEVTDALLKLRASPKLLKQMKTSGRMKVSSKYSNTILGQNYSKLYRGVTK